MASEVKKEEPVKTEAAKKKEANKGKEPWRHKLTSGKSHPDHNPPLQIVAQASPGNQKKYEDAINAEREKHNTVPDWRDFEGGVPADESNAEKPEYPVGPKPSHN